MCPPRRRAGGSPADSPWRERSRPAGRRSSTRRGSRRHRTAHRRRRSTHRAATRHRRGRARVADATTSHDAGTEPQRRQRLGAPRSARVRRRREVQAERLPRGGEKLRPPRIALHVPGAGEGGLGQRHAGCVGAVVARPSPRRSRRGSDQPRSRSPLGSRKQEGRSARGPSRPPAATLPTAFRHAAPGHSATSASAIHASRLGLLHHDVTWPRIGFGAARSGSATIFAARGSGALLTRGEPHQLPAIARRQRRRAQEAAGRCNPSRR